MCDEPPVPGDLSLCVRCCGLNRFGPGLELVAMTPAEEFAARVDHPELVAFELAWAAARRQEERKVQRGP